jgi:PhnB protein
MAVKPIPDGYHRVQPYLLVGDVAGQIEFLTNTFGAREIMRTTGGSGGNHAEVRIGESVIMMGGDSTPGWTPMPSALYVYCEDVDSTYQRALIRRGAYRRGGNGCRHVLACRLCSGIWHR